MIPEPLSLQELRDAIGWDRLQEGLAAVREGRDSDPGWLLGWYDNAAAALSQAGRTGAVRVQDAEAVLAQVHAALQATPGLQFVSTTWCANPDEADGPPPWEALSQRPLAERDADLAHRVHTALREALRAQHGIGETASGEFLACLDILEVTCADGVFLHIGSGDWATRSRLEPTTDMTQGQIKLLARGSARHAAEILDG